MGNKNQRNSVSYPYDKPGFQSVNEDIHSLSLQKQYYS